MAIQMRRGNEADLDISQLKAGEMAICTDVGKIIVKLAGEAYLTLTDMPDLQKKIEDKMGELTTEIIAEVGKSHTHNMSQVIDLPIATLKSVSTDEPIGAALCDIDGDEQVTATKTEAGVYLYDGNGNRYRVILATVANKGTLISSLSGNNYITVTDNGISAYADGVNIDSGWQDVTLNTTAFKPYNDTQANAPVYRRIGNMVQIKGVVSPAKAIAANGIATIGDIPADYAPSGINALQLCQGSSGKIWLLSVTTSGSINFQRYADAGAFVETPTSAWLPFSVTYML